MAPKQQNITNRKHLAHLEVVRRQTLAIRYTAIAIIIIVVGLVGYGIAAQTVLLPFRNVAKVNGEGIKASEFQARVKLARMQLIRNYEQMVQFAQFFGMDPTTDPNFSGQLQQISSQLNPANKIQTGQNVLDGMIDEVLILQEARKRGITVSADEIEKALQAGFNYFPNGTPTPTITATPPVLPTLDATALAMVTITPTASPIPTGTPSPTPTPDLSATPTPLPTATQVMTPTSTSAPSPTPTAYTYEGYQTQVALSMDTFKAQTGIDLDAYRKLTGNQLYHDKVFNAITVDIRPVEEQVWARHILVTTEDDAKKVLTRLAAGEDWNKIAAEVSQDTSNKDKGGDLGWFARGAMVKEFEDAAFALKPGETSQPVETSFGWHIIQVIAHENRPLTADQFQQAKQTYFDDWLKKTRDSADIKTYDLWKEIVPVVPEAPSDIPQ
jgi:peptidyl-prolyl cis-trans isomerase D